MGSFNKKGSFNNPITIDDSDDNGGEDVLEKSSGTLLTSASGRNSCKLTDFFQRLGSNVKKEKEISVLSDSNNRINSQSRFLKRKNSSVIDQKGFEYDSVKNICEKRFKKNKDVDRKEHTVHRENFDTNILPSFKNEPIEERSSNQNFNCCINNDDTSCIKKENKIKTKNDTDKISHLSHDSSQSFKLEISNLAENFELKEIQNKKDLNLVEKINDFKKPKVLIDEKSQKSTCASIYANTIIEQQLKNYRTYGKIIKLDRKTIGNILSIEQSRRLLGGKMSEERWDTISFVVHSLFKTVLDFVEHYDKKSRIKTPTTFDGILKPYQEEGLAFLVKRENTFPCGGILADDMGLGKTAQMISLILYQKEALQNSELEILRENIAKTKYLLPIKATLIVTPTGLMKQWHSEIRKFVLDTLTVGLFHGNNRTTNPSDLKNFDVIITSYGTVGSELAYLLENSDSEDEDENIDKVEKPKKAKKKFLTRNSILAKVCFQRIILDEAHAIKNRKSLVSKACVHLSGLRRWCITGTPIHNDLWDGFSLFRFLKTHPIDQEGIWKDYINPSNKHSLSRLELLVDAVLLRRTKDQQGEDGQCLVKLPEKTIEHISLDMDSKERFIYDQMFKAAQEFVRNFLEYYNDSYNNLEKFESADKTKNLFLNVHKMSGDSDDKFKNMACILMFLLRLRQACNHMSLTKSGLDLNCFYGEEENIMDEHAFAIASDSMDKFLNINCKELNDEKKHLQVFEESFISCKLRILLENIDKILKETNDKIIIVSQWTSMLRLIYPHLKERKIEFVEITGYVDTKIRQSAQEDINNPEKDKRIMLLSLKAGGVGLNLVGANHMFILDPHWNPFMEDQACDRIYRIGQTKNVFIYKLVCNNTIEQRVLNLQEKKRNISNTFLGKAGHKKGCKLTNEDLAYLFEVM